MHPRRPAGSPGFVQRTPIDCGAIVTAVQVEYA